MATQAATENKKAKKERFDSRVYFVDNNFFQANPEKILGIATEVSGKYTATVTIYKGTIDDLNKIDTPNYVNADMLAPGVSVETNLVSTATLTKKQIANIDKALSRSHSELNERAQIDTGSLDLISFDEIDKLYNAHISTEEKKVFVWYMMRVLGRKMEGGWTKYHTKYTAMAIPKKWLDEGLVAWDHTDRKYVPMFIFLSGKLAYKKSMIESHSQEIIEKVGPTAYEVLLQKVNEKLKGYQKKWMRLTASTYEERLQILPTSEFAKSIKIKGTRNGANKWASSNRNADYGKPDFKLEPKESYSEITEQNEQYYNHRYKKEFKEPLELPWAFGIWLKENRGKGLIRGGLTDNDIIELYIQNKKRGKDDIPEEFNKRKTKAREEGKRLFSDFLAEELLPEDQLKIETTWNLEYNSEIDVDLDRVPIGFSMARYYGGRATDIRPEKREGVAFAMIRGTGCLAYGVGIGKTWNSIFVVGQFLENGWSVRPFLTLPNQVYKQFIAECRGLLPQYPINDLYNFSPKFLDKVKGATRYEHEDGTIIPKKDINFGPGGIIKSFSYNGQTYPGDKIVTNNIESVPAKSISFITYEGFLRMGLKYADKEQFHRRLTDILIQEIEGDESKFNKKMMQRFNEKLEKIVGASMKDTIVKIEDLGFDMLVMDEAHNAKKIFTVVKGKKSDDLGKEQASRKEYNLTSGAPSSTGLKAFMISQYIQTQKKTGNILLLTATPFTNSPLEVFSMLSLMAYNYLEKEGLSNLVTFFDMFTKVRNELVIDAQLNPVYKEIFVGFANLPGLQQIIRRFFLYKDNAPNLKRPNKVVIPLKKKIVDGKLILNLKDGEQVSSILPLTPIQAKYMEEIMQYADGSLNLIEQAGMNKGKPIYKCTDREAVAIDMGLEDSEKEDAKIIDGALTDKEDKEKTVNEKKLDDDDQLAIRLLRAVNMARSVALSPYLYRCSELGQPSYKEYIESSNKLQYTMNCIGSVKEYHEKRGEQVSGQVIYMNRGVDYFPLIKEYLVRVVGYKEHEVGIIASETKMKQFKQPEKREVQNLFLGRRMNPITGKYEDVPDEYRVKVLIGSNTILEGINLQNYSSTLYNLFIPWNPTDVIQLDGRIWRQGNLFGSVRIVVPLMENSMDIFMFQKLEEKTSRINAIWDYGNNNKALNTEDFNPQELKYELIKDAVTIAKIEAKEKQVQVDDDILAEQRTKSLLDDYMKIVKDLEKERQNVVEWIQKYRDFQPTDNDGLITRNVNEILEDQTLKDGTPISVAHEKQPSWVKTWESHYIPKIITAPGNVQTFNTLRRRKTTIYKKIIVPNNWGELTNEQLKAEQKKIDEKVKKIEEYKKNIVSDEAIAARAKEIEALRAEKGYRPASIEDRLAEFERLNYLLSERDYLENKYEGLPIQKAKIKNGAKLKWDGKTVTVFEVVQIPGRQAMYWVLKGGVAYFIFENEFDKFAQRQEKDRWAAIQNEFKLLMKELKKMAA